MSKSNKNILLLMTGSIACYKACQVISNLKKQGHNLKVVMSAGSLNFVGSATVEGLAGSAPITDMYLKGQAMEHINLARWADLVLVIPATANYINKIAHGVGDDLLTTVFLAHDFTKPFILAPAMNTKMYLHPATQTSVQKLKYMGVEILETSSGVLACGETGLGRLLEPNEIMADLDRYLSANDTHKTSHTTNTSNTQSVKTKTINILITSGGTVESIDDVRVISNKSSGKTASQIADHLIESGLNITYLHAKQAQKPIHSCTQIAFTSFSDLENELQKLLKEKHFDWVIHAAAVSDFSPVPFSGKINSDSEEINLVLKRNPKIINQIKQISTNTKLVGFKLTSQAEESTIQKKTTQLFEKASCDYVVQNDWSQVTANLRDFRLYSSPTAYESIDDVNSLSFKLFQKIAEGVL